MFLPLADSRSLAQVAAVLCTLALPSPALVAELDSDDVAFFENEVRPVLVERCYDCHSEESGKRKGGLLLDRRIGWMEGGDGGPSIVPGDPEASLLIESVRYRNEHLQMPPKSRLSKEEIATLEAWVARGAPDPRDAALAGSVRRGEIDLEEARRGWAFRPVEASGRGIDDHLEEGLAQVGIGVAPPATPRERLRRLHYDLTGLPPTHEEVVAFETDPSEAAWRARIDELLARPAFGERWGRHWLDVVRYADSNGGDRNFTYHQAWRYRNYVIDAFNEDRGFYRFVEEQVAGDLLAAEEEADPAARRRALIGATFLGLGPKMLTERDKEKLRLDVADEQLDTLGRAFLGMTMGCARCHDHKFDPISQNDYYALAGILRSTETTAGTRNGCVNVASWIERPLPAENGEPKPELVSKLERLEVAMRLAVQKGYRAKAGATMSPGDLPFGGVLLDEADAEVTGSWRASTTSKRFYGKGYLVHHIKEDANPKRIVFRAALPESGTFEVRLAYTADANRHPAVPVRILGREEHRVVLDQRKKPEVEGLFQPLGRFEFEKDTETIVAIEPGEGEGFVLIDALQFIAVEDIEGERKALESVRSGPDAADPNSLEALYFLNQDQLKKEVAKVIKELYGAELAMAPREDAEPADLNLRVRGVTHHLGGLVPRGVPAVFAPEGPALEIPEGSSGRRELAAWLVSEEMSLLDRVFVNRIWHHLFGEGLVRTVDNFGSLGDRPSHPALLEDLAHRLRESGGSIKALVREIVASNAYQRSANAPAALAEADPENRLWGRQNRRRLAAEELRDSLLLAAGRLDRTPQGATARSFGVDIDAVLKLEEKTYRAVYLPVARNNPSGELAVFDMANPDLVSGARPATTVPTQALFLLNSRFLQTQAEHLAKTLAEAGTDPVSEAYRRVFQRLPGSYEKERAERFLEAAGQESGELKALIALAQALLSSTEFQFLD